MLPILKFIYGLFGKVENKAIDLNDPEVHTFTHTILSPSEKEKLIKKFIEDNFRHSVYTGKDPITKIFSDDIQYMIKKDRKERRKARHMRRFFYRKIKSLRFTIDILQHNMESIKGLNDTIKSDISSIHNNILINLLTVNIDELEYRSEVNYVFKIFEQDEIISNLNRKKIIMGKFFTIHNLIRSHSISPDDLLIFNIRSSFIDSYTGYRKTSPLYKEYSYFLDSLISFLDKL